MEKSTILAFIFLMLNTIPIHAQWMNGQAADLVLGQADFTSGMPNAGGTAMSNTLSQPAAVVVDLVNNKMYVSDSQNHRVLRFAYPPGSNQAAEAVLGQIDFMASSDGLSSNELHFPVGLSVDANGHLWVADASNHRVLRFDNAANKANGADADGVLGQPDFDTNSDDTEANGMFEPFDVFADANGTLWVADASNARVLRFDNAANKPNGAAADGVLGQADFTSNTPGTSATLMQFPTSVFVDNNGTLWVADAPNSRVLRFDNATGKPNGAAADGVLGQADFTSDDSGLSAASFSFAIGVFGDELGNIYVADFNNRVLVFSNAVNDPTVTTASYVIGQTDFVSNTTGTTASSLFIEGQLTLPFVDSQNGYLWMPDGANNRVLRYVANGSLSDELKYYVTTDGDDNNDGLSWNNAFASLQKAIEMSEEGNQIWVAQGTYYPTKEQDGTTDNSSAYTFYINKDIQLYGGFAGDETLLTQRPPYETMPTILSADLGIEGDVTDNAYTVIHTQDLSTAFFLDGFFIQDGYSTATSGDLANQIGGGWYNDGQGGTSNPRISNCTFQNNRGNFGGAMYNNGENAGDSSPEYLNCKFIKNNSGATVSSIRGGAIYNNGTDGNSSPTFINCLFVGNALEGSFARGGAIFNESQFSGSASPNIINCTFYGNAAQNGSSTGGAIYNELFFGGTLNCTVSNCIFWNNDDEVVNTNADINFNISYSIFDDGNANGTLILPQHSTDGGNNFDANPLFIDADGTDDLIGTSDDNLRFNFDAPGHNAGNDAVVTASTDIAGDTRILDAAVDMGVYELGCRPIYVNINATSGANNGTTWEDAYINLQDALSATITCDEKVIWVAQGTYLPTANIGGDDSDPHSRENTFEIEESVSVYGGFQGNETALSERDYELYPTILSGNLGEPGVSTDNARYVLFIKNNDNKTFIIDGFNIQDGYSNLGFNQYGGAIYSSFGDGVSDLIVMNCIFKNNYAAERGGAIYLYVEGSKGPLVSDYRGLELINCVFLENDSKNGSALYLRNANTPIAVINAQATNCTFYNNISSVEDINNSVIYIEEGANATSNDLDISNCIFWGNEDEMSRILGNATLNIEHSIIDDGTADGMLMLPADVTDGGNNLDADPLFLDDLNGNLHLSSSSPAINAGDNNAVDATVTQDLAGNERIQNETIDMGAYESAFFPLSVSWLDFVAYRQHKTVLLEWTTANELNNKGFEVEHSKNGRDWLKLDVVSGIGTAQGVQQYHFVHSEPQQGLNYYRLKQGDFDGIYTYSEIRTVFFEKEGNEVSIYPNPTSDVLHIYLESFLENAEVQLIDIFGKVLLQQIVGSQSVLMLNHLPKGVYVLKINHGDTEYVKQMVIQ